MTDNQTSIMSLRNKWLQRLSQYRGTDDVRLRSSHVHVAVCLYFRMDDKKAGEAWPSQKHIAEFTGLSLSSVEGILKDLSDTKWIKILSGKSRTKPASKRGVHYRLSFPSACTSNLNPQQDAGLNETETHNQISLNPQFDASIPPPQCGSHSTSYITSCGAAQAAAAKEAEYPSSNIIGESPSLAGTALERFPAELAYGCLGGPLKGDQICSIEGHKPELDENEREIPTIYERTDEPKIGDYLDIGGGAFVTIADLSISSGGTTRDLDGLMADRREDEAFDLAAFVATFVERRIYLSTFDSEPTSYVVRQLSVEIRDETGIDLETVSRFVEDHLWKARRCDDDADNTEC